jgi:hypothetical protein
VTSGTATVVLDAAEEGGNGGVTTVDEIVDKEPEAPLESKAATATATTTTTDVNIFRRPPPGEDVFRLTRSADDCQ